MMGNNPLQERRQYKRVDGFFEVFVNFKPESPKKFHCHSQDISEGGMRIKATHPLKQGNHAILTFNLPNYPKEISTQVVVAWACPEPKKDGTYDAGVEFLVINEDEREAINSYVSQHQDKTI